MRPRSLLVLLAALLPLAGCSERAEAPLVPQAPSAAISTDVDLTNVLEFVTLPDLTASRHAEKYIRAGEGGFVELHGFRVDIPAGALPQDTLVTIDLPEDELLGKHVLAEFGPHGVQFSTPVTVSFPLEGVLLTGDSIEVSRWENDAWAPLGGTISADGKTLSSTTPHFSTYGGTFVMGGG